LRYTVTYLGVADNQPGIRKATVEADDYKQSANTAGTTVEFFNEDRKHVATFTNVHEIRSERVTE
jgi:hypothetical protein